ncbi:MAG: FtsH protease activity modulator HflK [Pseudomonadota bacterium]
MPWQDNSGNNGGPTKGPWGQPPRGNNNNGSGRGPGGGRSDPPDLEELLQASRKRLKRAFPGGSGSGGRLGGPNPAIFGLFGAALLVLFLLSGIYQVGPQERGVKTTFGEFSGISDPGLHWLMPIVQGATIVAVDEQQSVEINGGGSGAGRENLMLTSDRNIVDVNFSVDYRVSRTVTEPDELPNAAKYIFNIENPRQMVIAVSEAAMRETIGAKELEPIITSGQADVVEQTRQRIQETLDYYDSGIEVLRVNMEKPEVPAAVRDAFADVIKARNEKARMINDAERNANQIIPVAQGDGLRVIQEARAYAARVEEESVGQAERFNKIYEEYRRAPQVTRQRMYLETVESVLGGMNKIIIEDNAGSGVVPYLPLTELQRKSSEVNPQ